MLKKRTYRAEACETFIKKVRFDRIDSFYHYVQSDVKFLALNEQRVLYVSLHQVLIMIRISRQIVEFLYQ